MNRPSKRALPIATALAAVGLLLWTLWMQWPGLYVAYCSWSAERSFREKYGDVAAAHVVIDASDWALYFGGRRGLARLEALSRDPGITEGGRELARKAHEAIVQGRHLLYLELYLEREHWWPRSFICYLRYIRGHDSRFYPSAMSSGSHPA